LPATSLAQLVLALAIEHGHPGRSPYSYEPVVECGTDPKQALCRLEPVCADGSPNCRAPKFSRVRNAWVRVETRETALGRFARIARTLSETAERLVRCTGESRTNCEPIAWSSGAKPLALAGLTVALHESGLREDIQFGHPPLGRGPAGEACLMQVALDQVPQHASWLPAEAREAIFRQPHKREQLARTLLGDSQAALERCFEVGLRALARSRKSCEKAAGSWDIGMFSLYGSGKNCKVPLMIETRVKTFRTLTAARPQPSAEIAALLE
jgi:hypothetical protein